MPVCVQELEAKLGTQGESKNLGNKELCPNPNLDPIHKLLPNSKHPFSVPYTSGLLRVVFMCMSHTHLSRVVSLDGLLLPLWHFSMAYP